jgi:FlgD Ig-like domain
MKLFRLAGFEPGNCMIRPTPASPPAGRRALRSITALSALWATLAITPHPATAALTSIRTRPEPATVCDTLALLVSGLLPNSCYHVIHTQMEGPIPLPTAGPVPSYGLRVRITVQEPDPRIEVACSQTTQPYEKAFYLDQTAFGNYAVHAVEYLVPFSADSTGSPKDSTTLDGSFFVGYDRECPPPQSCFILDFQRDASAALVCDAVGTPGGTACVNLGLLNWSAVGGVQTVINVFDPTLDPTVGTPLPGAILHPVSVETTDRSAGFHVVWTAEESRAKILLFSPTGATIQPGSGPILRVCYAIGSETHEGVYLLRYGETIVADPEGTALQPCPTFAEIVGRLCIGTRGCDLNGDGHSDILDVIRLVHCALGDSLGACPDSVAQKADCNADGAIDIRDVICCVRKILTFGSSGSEGAVPVPAASGETRIGFTGPVRWLTPLDGEASIEIEPGEGFGGVQFALEAGGAPARITRLSIYGPSGGYQLESAVDPNGRRARGILYRLGSSSAGPVTVHVGLEAAPEGTSGSLLLLGIRAGTESAEPMAATTTSATAAVPAVSAASAPLVLPARPNPFTNETEIAYSLPSARHVTLRLYAATGRLVRTLVDRVEPGGIHRATWDGRDAGGREVGSGIYFFRFSTGDVERTSRLLKLR